MARNRKRSPERGARRANGERPPAPENGERSRAPGEQPPVPSDGFEPAADEQLAAPIAGRESERDEDEAPPPLEHAAPDVELAEAQLSVGRPSAAEAADLDGEDGDISGAPAETLPVPRERVDTRLVNFVQGSWRELQRVQWPDRRQVTQATGVVLGFVIVAGAYLGLADGVAGKLVDFILK